MSVKAHQEADGSTSMRRVLAAYFALLGGASFILAAVLGTMSGVWAGIACVLAVLVLLGLTTMQEIQALTTYKLADAIGTGAAVADGDSDEEGKIGFKGN